ncbi:LOW QUALITY PROTEIN: hypothetical protein V2J09_012189 [Rumex salicifolius]
MLYRPQHASSPPRPCRRGCFCSCLLFTSLFSSSSSSPPSPPPSSILWTTPTTRPSPSLLSTSAPSITPPPSSSAPTSPSLSQLATLTPRSHSPTICLPSPYSPPVGLLHPDRRRKAPLVRPPHQEHHASGPPTDGGKRNESLEKPASDLFEQGAVIERVSLPSLTKETLMEQRNTGSSGQVRRLCDGGGFAGGIGGGRGSQWSRRRWDAMVVLSFRS